MKYMRELFALKMKELRRLRAKGLERRRGGRGPRFWRKLIRPGGATGAAPERWFRMRLWPWVGVLVAVIGASVAPAHLGHAQGPDPPRPAATYDLCGRILAPSGWGSTCANVGNPGPSLTASAGESVTLNLLAGDGPLYSHRWLLDYNGNGLIEAGEPASGFIGSPTTPVVYTFTVAPSQTPGTYAYICAIHGAFYQSGNFVVTPSTLPTITLSNPSGTPARWTGGIPKALTWTLSDPNDPVTSLVVYVNYSYNGGANTGAIAGPLTGGATSFTWTVPRVNATDVHVLATAIDPSGGRGTDDKAVPVIDSAPPGVASVVPPDLATQVNRGTWINVTFTEAMNQPSAEAAVSLCRMPGCTNVPLAVVGWTGSTVNVRPAALLAPNTDYQGTVSIGARDASDPGNAMSAPFLWSFRTANNPPTVTVTRPAAGARWTGGTAHAIDWSAADPEDPPIEVRVWMNYSATGAAPWTALFAGDATATTTSWPAPPDDTEAAVFEVTAVDTAGARGIGRSAVFAVDSTRPRVVSTNPGEGAVNVAVNANLLVVLSERMNPGATGVPSGVALQEVGTGAWVPLAYSWDGTGAGLTADPLPFLRAGTAYRLFVNATARDVADPGLTLGAGVTVNFTTSAAPDVARPVIADVAAVPPTQLAGGSVEVSANVTDDAAVASVSLNVTLPDTSALNRTMARGTGNRWSVTGPWMQVGAHAFVIWAVDTSGNVASASGSFTIAAPDTAPPRIAHSPPAGLIYTDTTISIVATVTDDRRVQAVHLDYVDVSGVRHNETMTLQGGPYGDAYGFTLPAQPSPGTVRFATSAGSRLARISI
jgi:hypothetical protein